MVLILLIITSFLSVEMIRVAAPSSIRPLRILFWPGLEDKYFMKKTKTRQSGLDRMVNNCMKRQKLSANSLLLTFLQSEILTALVHRTESPEVRFFALVLYLTC